MERATVALAMCALATAQSATAAESGDSADASATVVIESPDLAGMVSVPIFNARKVDFSVSSFAGCSADSNEPPPLQQLVKGRLVPKKNSETVTVPGNLDVAVFATYVNTSGGNSVSCTNALRFRSEPGRTYHVRYIPPMGFHLVRCDMAIYESQDGKELPVASAHKAPLVNKGIWKGSELNICAGADQPIEKPAS